MGKRENDMNRDHKKVKTTQLFLVKSNILHKEHHSFF